MNTDSSAPRPKKSRRYTAEPQRVSESTLVGVFELPHGAGRPAQPDVAEVPVVPDKSADAGGVDPHAEDGAAVASPIIGGDPLLEAVAAEDDPRRWGDGDDDLGDWMKSQRPPHWS